MSFRDGPITFPLLRFHKLALRLVQEACTALHGAVHDSLCVIFAVTAPIWESSKTTSSLINTIRATLSREAVLGEQAHQLHGNEVRVRVVMSRSPDAARVVGILHNPNPPLGTLLDLGQSLIESEEALNLAISACTVPT